MSTLLSLILLFSALLPASWPEATPLVKNDNGDDVVSGRIISSVNTVGRGEEFILGAELIIAPGWHIYGPKSGKEGLPTTISWYSENVDLMQLPMPAAAKYHNSVVNLARGTTKPLFSGKSAQIALSIDLVACNNHGCIPGKGLLQQTLPVQNESRLNDDNILDFLTAAANNLDNSDAASDKSDPATVGNSLSSIGKLPAERTAATEETATADIPLWLALLLAFGGGMLLNVMPCVLPVIFLKLFNLCTSKQLTTPERLKHGLFYTLGIISAMLLLAITVIIVKYMGQNVGWGFQFQHQPYLITIILILGLVAYNLLGIFEFSWTPKATLLHQARHRCQGCTRQFLEGILTVIVSTPCSAPLLATAIGVALAGSNSIIILFFLVIGLGIAFPFCLLLILPPPKSWRPCSGPWMNIFRQILGFIMLGVVIWLCWVLGKNWGLTALCRILVVLLATAFSCWLFGLLQKKPGSGWPGKLLALLLIPLALCGTYHTFTATPTEINWQQFNKTAIQKDLERGHPVLVIFTADWCLTCKANELAVFGKSEVINELNKNNIALYKADWTKRDDDIRQELAGYKRAGVPLYLLYDPQKSEAPLILPEILTPQILHDYIKSLTK